MKRVINTTIFGLIFISLVLTGCGGPPQNNPLLTDAEQSYNKIKNDSLVVQKAPVALKEAEEALDESRNIWKDKGDRKMIEHYAYIAKQKTKIARETAKLNAAQEEVEQAESERKQVLIEARKAEAVAAENRAEEAREQAQREKTEANMAKQDAEMAREEAEAARKEAREARDRAEELASKLSELEAKQTERGMVLTLSDVLFDFDSANLKAGASKVVNELTSFLNEYPERKILIEGFTDNVGSNDYNEELSQKRADALRKALTRSGIDLTRIRTIGYGEEYPVATNNNEAGRQQNRRVEIIISDKSGTISQRTN